MKHWISLTLVFLCAILINISSVNAGENNGSLSKGGAMEQKWEYKVLRLYSYFDMVILRFEDDKKFELNPPTNALPRIKELGDQGWELISTTVFKTGGDDLLQLWFKRQKN